MSAMFSRLAAASAVACGRPITFILALTGVVGWIICGFWVGFSDPVYQLWINTITTVITFLMVFLIQNSQNRDTAAIQAKLDALVKASDAPNDVIGLERK